MRQAKLKNRNARIDVLHDGSRLLAETSNRDPSSMTASVEMRRRSNSQKSFVALSITTATGQVLDLSGAEARTLYRLMSRALDT